jgi:N-acetylneuraminic acid mutarotase
MPAFRFGAAGRVVNGELYVVGGNDGQNVVATTFAYDPAIDRWSTLATMPTARA